MSIYTEHKKIKSLWHPITDDDFNIDWTKSVALLRRGNNLFLFEDKKSLCEIYEEKELFCVDGKTMTEKFKHIFREEYYGYMYIDDVFFKAIESYKCSKLQDITERADSVYLFIKRRDGSMEMLDSSDFTVGGYLRNIFADFNAAYFVNLRSCPITSPDVLFVDCKQE